MTEEPEFAAVIQKVMPFAERLKKDLIASGRVSGRRRCPLHEASGAECWVHARLSGRKLHLSVWCDDPKCQMRLIE